MAAKYWYKVGNGSADWGVASNWYLGSGGTGGTTTVPTTSDTVYLDQASGSGTLSINAAALCNGLICTGFTGTLAGASALTITDTTSIITDLIRLSASMTFTWSGLLTINGSGSATNITAAGKTFGGSVTLSKSNAAGVPYYYPIGDWVVVGTVTHTLSILGGNIEIGKMYFGSYIQSGTGAKDIAPSNYTIDITGSGSVLTILNQQQTKATFVLTNTSSNPKTVISSATVANGVEPNLIINGNGTGSYVINGSTTVGGWDIVNINNSGGASVNFGAGTIGALYFNNSNVNWNNSATTLTFANGGQYIQLSPNMQITASAAISITSSGNQVYFTSNGKTFTGAITAGAGSTIWCQDTFRLNNVLNLTNGNLQGNVDVWVSSLSSSSSNTRDITVVGTLYFTGAGTLATVTTSTNLTTAINAISINDTTIGGAKTLTFNAVFGSPTVYIAGTTAGLITLAAANTFLPYVYVTNTGGTVSFTSGTIGNLEFVNGTTCTWSNAATQTLNIVNDLKFAVGQPLSTVTPAMILNQSISNITMNGNRLVTGALTVGWSSGDTTFTDNFSSNAAVTITDAYTDSAAEGNFTCSTLTINGSGVFTFKKNLTAGATTISGSSSVTISGILPQVVNITTLTVSSANSDPLAINGGTFTCTSISNTSTYPIAIYNGTTLNCSSISLTAGSSLNAAGNSIINCTGAFLSSAGNVNFTNTIATFLTFSLSGVTSNYAVNDSKIFITGTGAAAFSLAATIASYTSSYTIIEFNSTAASNATFAGGGFTYYELIFNRRTSTFNNVITGSNTFTNLRDWGTAAHFLVIATGSTQTIGHFDVHGSPGNLITIARSLAPSPTLIKSPAGVVACDYVTVSNILASPGTATWYAGPNSSLTGTNTGWNTGGKVRRMGSGGAG